MYDCGSEHMRHNILNELTCSVERIGKSGMTAGDEFRITLQRGGKEITFLYHDNIYNDSTLEDYVQALLADKQYYDEIDWHRPKDEIISELGFSEQYDYAEGLLDGLKENAGKVDYMFTKEEQKELMEEYN